MLGEFLEENLAVIACVERRSERLALRISLKMSARLTDGSRISVEVKTLVVNAHGGLLDVGIELKPGQRITLDDSRRPEQITAIVLRVERCEEGRFIVAFEFEFPTPDFWRTRFPPGVLP
jgi:hypothetical protein